MDWWVYLLTIIAAFIAVLTALRVSSQRINAAFRNKNVLLVTAHPDDECMFFTPMLTALQHANLHILCLSTGNADGLGEKRVNELIKSAAVFGIPANRTWCVDDPRLQDGMKQHWDTNAIVSHVTRAVDAFRIDFVITFDDYGISGHPNHIAVAHACRYILCTGDTC